VKEICCVRRFRSESGSVLLCASLYTSLYSGYTECCDNLCQFISLSHGSEYNNNLACSWCIDLLLLAFVVFWFKLNLIKTFYKKFYSMWWLYFYSYSLHIVNDQKSTRGRDLILTFSHCRIDSRLFYFGPRVAKVWNSIPYNIVHSPSVNVFKNVIKMFDFSKFLILNFVN